MTPASLVSRTVSSRSLASTRPHLLLNSPKRSSYINRKQQRVHASSSSDPANDDAAAPAAEALASSPGAAALAAAAVKPEETNLFLDPLVRSLLLGVGAGMACETLHVVFKVRRRQLRASGQVEFACVGDWNRGAQLPGPITCIKQGSVRALQPYRGCWQLLIRNSLRRVLQHQWTAKSVQIIICNAQVQSLQ